jgi:hypothetical protein
MLNCRSLFVFTFLLILFSIRSSAQSSSGSPYSRYGIGDLQFEGFTKNTGMGGIAYGLSPLINLNITNPASYSSLMLTTFETAVNMNQTQLKTSTNTQNINSTNLSYFSFGFPVKSKKWGAAFGLLPYSNVGYSINDHHTNADGDDELHTYQGKGGLNQFFIGNAYSPFKNFSIGANASYLFGVVEQERRIEFPVLANYFNTRINQSTAVGSVAFNFGMQFTFDSLRTMPSDSIRMLDKKLKVIGDSLNAVLEKKNQSLPDQKSAWDDAISKLRDEHARTLEKKKHVVHRKDKSDWSLTLGIVGAPETSLRATNSRLIESFHYNAFNQIIVRDTIENVSGADGKLTLPFSAGFGMAMKKGNRWLIGADFSMQNWKNYSYFGTNDSLANSWRISAGVQFVPNDRNLKSYWEIVQYRMGFHYEQTYLQLRNNQLTEYGLSVGIGMPLKRSAAMLHFSLEGGRRGTISENLIQENFLKLSIGFTLNDRWFVKPKFD